MTPSSIYTQLCLRFATLSLSGHAQPLNISVAEMNYSLRGSILCLIALVWRLFPGCIRVDLGQTMASTLQVYRSPAFTNKDQGSSRTKTPL